MNSGDMHQLVAVAIFAVALLAVPTAGLIVAGVIGMSLSFLNSAMYASGAYERP